MSRLGRSRSRPPLSCELLETRRVLATFTVNTSRDTVDVVPGDGNATDDLGQTSLRAAIMEANALTGNHTILLMTDVVLNIASLSGEDLDANASLKSGVNDLDIGAGVQIAIRGGGANISAAFGVISSDTRIFDLQPGSSLLLDQVVLTGGRVGLSSAFEPLGGGAIRARDATLTINSSSLSNNHATLGGGAIEAQGGLVAIAQSTITGNRQIDSGFTSNQLVGGGGIRITDCGRLQIATSTVGDNHATVGGGIFVDSRYYCYGEVEGIHEISITDSTIRENIAEREGGGLFVTGSPEAHIQLLLAGSTISGNAAAEGGGLWIYFGQPYHEARLVNVTISGNAAMERGGGLFLNADTYDGISLEHVTVAENLGFSGGIDSAGAAVRIRDSIFANNAQVDTAGRFFSTGVNLVEQPGTATGWKPSDLLFVDPLLLPLADNGWITKTHFLSASSPAIDRASLSKIPIDQLRRARVGLADLGATERIVDGSIAGQVTIGGVPAFAETVTLFTDLNGNGLIDGFDAAVASTITDANGGYAFSQLPSGNYLVSTLDVQAAATIQESLLATIDSFDITPQAATAGTDGASTAFAIESVGLKRTLDLQTTADSASLAVQGGRLGLSVPGGETSTASLIWNGLNALSPPGLDLSAAPAAAGLRTVFTSPAGVESIRAILTSVDGGTSEIAAPLPSSASPREWLLPFNDLVPLQSGGVDLGRISEVRLELTGPLLSETFLEYVDVFAPAAASINIDVPNAPPIAVDDQETGDEDTQLIGDVSSNDMDPDDDSLIYTTDTLPAQGMVELQTDGSFVYIPNANFFGEDSFTYRVRDSFGNEAGANVVLIVRPVNDLPAVMDQTIMVQEDDDFRGPLAVEDLENDPLLFELTEGPDHGEVMFIPGTLDFVYVPAADFFGNDRFVYAVDDGGGTAVFGTVSVLVVGVNDCPVAVDLMLQGSEDVELVSPLPAIDVDRDEVMFSLVQPPIHGEVNITPDGLMFYSPDLNYSGKDSFRFAVTDGFDCSSSATVSIDLLPVNDDPTASDLRFSTGEDARLAAALGVVDVDGDIGEYVVTQQPARGSVSISGGGQFVFQPALNAYGPDEFLYTFFDLQGGSVSRTVTLDVFPDGAEVSGFLFNDANRDGQRQPTESGLINRTVYIDSNQNGFLDSDEMRTLSDATGHYFFPDVPDGNQKIGVSLAGGDGQTSPQGGFTAGATPITPLIRSMAPLDVDDDGDLDVVVVGELDGELVVAINDGDGNFQRGMSVSVGVRPQTVRAADFNGDGIGDLIVTVAGVERNADSSQVLVLNGIGDGTFVIAHRVDAGQGPLDLVVLDADQDGDLDAVITSYRSREVVILDNDGRGLMTVAQRIPIAGQPISIAVGDVNGDGAVDLIVADYLADEVVLLTNRQGTFSVGDVVARGVGPSYVHLDDLDGDGVLDLGVSFYGRTSGQSIDFVANDSVAILKGDGQGGFAASQPTMQLPAGARAEYLTFADIDLDGDRDMLVVESEREVISVFTNTVGRFTRASDQEFLLGPVGSAGPEWVVVGNFNRDGNPDVIASTLQGEVRVFMRAPGALAIEAVTGRVIVDQNFGLIPAPGIPKATAALSAAATAGHNPSLPTDVNRDSRVAPLDALLVINCLNMNAADQAAADSMRSLYADVNDDGWVTPLDALLIINALSTSPPVAASSSGTAMPHYVGQLDLPSATTNSESTASSDVWMSGRSDSLSALPAVTEWQAAQRSTVLERSGRRQFRRNGQAE